MTSDDRESRFEQLRRRAEERLREVRENIERGMSIPETETETAPSARPEAVATPVEPERPQESWQEPASILPEENRGPDAWEQRVVVPTHHPQEPTAQASSSGIAPTIALAPTVHSPKTQPAGKVHRSPAAQLLQKSNLRQAIIAQEILGKPLSMRPSQDEE
jgi:hypothetical protein